MGSESNPEGRIGWEREKDGHGCIMLGAGQDRDRLEASFLMQKVYGVYTIKSKTLQYCQGMESPFCCLFVWLSLFFNNRMRSAKT